MKAEAKREALAARRAELELERAKLEARHQPPPGAEPFLEALRRAQDPHAAVALNDAWVRDRLLELAQVAALAADLGAVHRILLSLREIGPAAAAKREIDTASEEDLLLYEQRLGEALERVRRRLAAMRGDAHATQS